MIDDAPIAAETPLPDLQIVYILTNPSMPGLIKIGRTTNLEARVMALSSSTSAPEPFQVAYAAIVEDAAFVERALHAAFSMHRMTGREFFRMPAENAIAALSLAELEQVAEAKAPSGGSDIVSEIVSRAICRSRAQADIENMVRTGAVIPSQETLAERWGVGKGTVSKWLIGFENDGLIVRETVGRCKTVRAA
jgi:hypothetical protein